MRLSKQKLAPPFALLFIALLVLPAMSGFRVRTAGPIMQDNSRSDVQPTVKISMGTHVAALAESVCPEIVINGTLGSGAADPPDEVVAQTSGLQLGRLNRNTVSSTCAAPKICDIFIPTGLRAFDAYSIVNQSSDPQCVSVNLDSNDVCNLQTNAYLTSYDPNSICTNYLADPGLSTGVPPTATNMSFIVPGGATLIVVVHTTNLGETGCDYTVTITGDLCQPFDCCIQSDDGNRILQFNSETGAYRFQDCSKGVTLEGTGEISRHLCMIKLSDTGPDPNNPDRFVMAHVSKGEDPRHACTFIGDANVRTTARGKLVHIHDSDVRDSTCVCPGPQ